MDDIVSVDGGWHHILWFNIMPVVVAMILAIVIIYITAKTTPRPEPRKDTSRQLIDRLEINEWRDELLSLAGIELKRYEAVKKNGWDFTDDENARVTSILKKYDAGRISESTLLGTYSK